VAHFVRNLRNNITTGILLMIPLALTIWLLTNLFETIDSVLPKFFHMIYPKFPEDKWGIQGVGFIVLLVLAYVVGVASKKYIGQKLIDLGNNIISNIPIINKIYNGIQQILDGIVTGNKKLFEKAAIIEYPKEGCYSIGFITATTTGEIPQHLNQDLVSIFVPTTPNPTSGFLLFLPRHKVIELEMSVETAIKLIVSAGIVNSDEIKKTQHLYVSKPGGKKGWNWWKNLTHPREFPVSDPRD